MFKEIKKLYPPLKEIIIISYLWQKCNNNSKEDCPNIGSFSESVGQRVLIVDLIGEFRNWRHFPKKKKKNGINILPNCKRKIIHKKCLRRPSINKRSAYLTLKKEQLSKN